MMRVLFTGGSSFTGAWFARSLADAGFEVVLFGRSRHAARDPEARARLEQLLPDLRRIDGAPLGSPAMLRALEREAPFDLLCLHGAAVGDHRDPHFDALAAAAADTRGLGGILDRMRARGLRAVVWTGSLFEADEGCGERPLRAFSAYGLAKTLGWQIVRHACETRGITLGKFVVGSPFGPFQKPGLCRELIEAWLAGRVPVLRRPGLLRDHVHVELLATLYAGFARELAGGRGTSRLVPSCYAEPLAAFAERLAREMRPRLGRPCRFLPADPPEPGDEPHMRFGLESVAALAPDFDWNAAWDRLAAWHLARARGDARDTGAMHARVPEGEPA